jgi:hypothetical protein
MVSPNTNLVYFAADMIKLYAKKHSLASKRHIAIPTYLTKYVYYTQQNLDILLPSTLGKEKDCLTYIHT